MGPLTITSCNAICILQSAISQGQLLQYSNTHILTTYLLRLFCLPLNPLDHHQILFGENAAPDTNVILLDAQMFELNEHQWIFLDE